MRCLLILIATTFVLSAWPVLAERRAAFVVGNSAYEKTSDLRNPTSDARLVAATLERLNFEVSLHFDLTREKFARALSEYLRTTDNADVSFFYYAGHGIQYEGQNFLLGTDALLQSEFDIAGETIALNTVIEALERRSAATLVFIDACRDNPLADAFYTENFADTRSLNTRGMAEVSSVADGTMLMFAASPGQVAYDGTGPNSPFSLALARHLPAENVEVLSLMKRVIRDTRLLTGGKQSPTVTNDLAQDVFLRRVQESPSAPSLAENAARDWKDFRDSQSADALERFAAKYPETAYAALARERALRVRRREASDTSAQKPAVEPAVEPPPWCQMPDGKARELICQTPALIEQEARIARLYRDRLDSLGGGDAYGEVLVEHAAWGAERDACADSDCLNALYERRALALMGLPEGLTPDQQVVYLVQTELNRLSCGAGKPDGQAGKQTRAALARLARETDKLAANADPSSIVTLTHLRELPDYICSVLVRAHASPTLLAGVWRLTTRCEEGNTLATGVFVGSMLIEHKGGKKYSALFNTRHIGRRTPFDGELRESAKIGFVDIDPVAGYRRQFQFAPGAGPFDLEGASSFRCRESATKE